MATDPAAYAQALALQQQQQAAAAAAANYHQLLQMQQQQAAYAMMNQQGLGATAPRAALAAAKPASRKSQQPLPVRTQSRASRRDYDSDDDDDDEFEDYSHLLTPAERDRRKKRLIGTGDRDSDEDFHSPPGSSSSSEEEESSSEEEEEDEGEGEVTTSEEEDFGYGPPKKDRDLPRKHESDEEYASDAEVKKKKRNKQDEGRDRAAALSQFLRTVEVPLRRQLLRFFDAVMYSHKHKVASAAATREGKEAPAPAWPALPGISQSIAEWDKPEAQRMAFCELLNLCPIEAKADKPEPYHYLRPVCAQGINFYCTFAPDRPPARSIAPPNPEWVKRFEDRVKQWFALEPIGQYMATLPPVTADEKSADAAFQAAITAVTAGAADPAAASAAGADASASASASAAAEAPAEAKSEKKEKLSGKKKKKNREEEDGSDAEAAEEDGSARKGKSRGGAADGARKKQKKGAAAAAAAAAAEDDGDEDAKEEKGKVTAHPSSTEKWRTLLLQQLDVGVRRQVLQLVASSMPTRLVEGHRENFASKFGKELIALTFARVAELAGITPKHFDAKATDTQVQHYFSFKPTLPVDKTLRLPNPSFVTAFQNSVREWLRSAPVVALMGSEYYINPLADQNAEDAEFTKAQADARAVAPIEYMYTLPNSGVAPAVKAGAAQ